MSAYGSGRAWQITTASLVVTAMLAVGAAEAGTFEVKTPDITKGENEFSVNYANQSGFPRNADPVRQSLEIGYAYSPTEWFLVSVKGNPDQPVDGNWQLTTAGTETQLRFGKAQPGFDFGWYTAVDVRVYREATNTLTFGPILQFGNDKVSLTVNPFLQRTFGPNSTDAMDFFYAVQGKVEMQKGIAVGFESYGLLPDLGKTPGVQFQEHRIGPMLYLEGPIGEKREGKANEPKARLEMGALFGLTEATANTTVRAKLSITW